MNLIDLDFGNKVSWWHSKTLPEDHKHFFLSSHLQKSIIHTSNIFVVLSHGGSVIPNFYANYRAHYEVDEIVIFYHILDKLMENLMKNKLEV